MIAPEYKLIPLLLALVSILACRVLGIDTPVEILLAVILLALALVIQWPDRR